MPYKDKAKQNKFQLKYLKNRRQEWLWANGPCKVCATFKKLELSYIKKRRGDIKTAGIWSLTEVKRKRILARCEVLCHKCNEAKLRGIKSERKHGKASYDRGCRCEICKGDKNKKSNNYRWRTSQRKSKDWKLMEKIQNKEKSVEKNPGINNNG